IAIDNILVGNGIGGCDIVVATRNLVTRSTGIGSITGCGDIIEGAIDIVEIGRGGIASTGRSRDVILTTTDAIAQHIGCAVVGSDTEIVGNTIDNIAIIVGRTTVGGRCIKSVTATNDGVVVEAGGRTSPAGGRDQLTLPSIDSIVRSRGAKRTACTVHIDAVVGTIKSISLRHGGEAG